MSNLVFYLRNTTLQDPLVDASALKLEPILPTHQEPHIDHLGRGVPVMNILLLSSDLL
jgi:hypothetical protein